MSGFACHDQVKSPGGSGGAVFHEFHCPTPVHKLVHEVGRRHIGAGAELWDFVEYVGNVDF